MHDREAMVEDEDDYRRWGTIAVPVLLRQGELTRAPMPQAMAESSAPLPGVRLQRRVLAGQSHIATHTAPEVFADAVREFLIENAA